MKFVSSKFGRALGVICCILVGLSVIVLVTYPLFYLKIGGSPLRGYKGIGDGEIEIMYFIKKGESYLCVDEKTWTVGRYYEGAFCASFPIVIFGGFYALVYLNMIRNEG